MVITDPARSLHHSCLQLVTHTQTGDAISDSLLKHCSDGNHTAQGAGLQVLGEAPGKTEAQGRHSSSSSNSSEADSRQRAQEKRRDANKSSRDKGTRQRAAALQGHGGGHAAAGREPAEEGRGAPGGGRRPPRLGAVTAPGSARKGRGGARPERARSSGARASPPHTHRWELRNGGGGRGGEPGGRARRSQSPPPASFEPAPKTAEGMG